MNSSKVQETGTVLPWADKLLYTFYTKMHPNRQTINASHKESAFHLERKTKKLIYRPPRERLQLYQGYKHSTQNIRYMSPQMHQKTQLGRLGAGTP